VIHIQKIKGDSVKVLVFLTLTIFSLSSISAIRCPDVSGTFLLQDCTYNLGSGSELSVPGPDEDIKLLEGREFSFEQKACTDLTLRSYDKTANYALGLILNRRSGSPYFKQKLKTLTKSNKIIIKRKMGDLFTWSNTKKLTITKNGKNLSLDMSEDRFHLIQGSVTIHYTCKAIKQ